MGEIWWDKTFLKRISINVTWHRIFIFSSAVEEQICFRNHGYLSVPGANIRFLKLLVTINSCHIFRSWPHEGTCLRMKFLACFFGKTRQRQIAYICTVMSWRELIHIMSQFNLSLSLKAFQSLNVCFGNFRSACHNLKINPCTGWIHKHNIMM